MGLSKQQLRKLEKRLQAKNKKLAREKEEAEKAAAKQSNEKAEGKGKKPAKVE